MTKKIIATDKAPAAIGTYSQAVSTTSGTTVYLSGQIPLVPETMTLVTGGIVEQAHQVFKNLNAVCQAAEGSLADIVKLTIYLTDLSHFADVNTVMAMYFDKPYPARAAIGIKQLPKEALIEIDGVMVVSV